MNASGRAGMPPLPAHGEPSLLCWQASMQNQGAQHLDPARFHFLDVLSGRADAAFGELRRVLEDKLKAAQADYGERFQQAQAAARVELTSLCDTHTHLAAQLRQLFAAGDFRGMRRLGAQSVSGQACAPLVQLNQHLQKVRPENTNQLESDPDPGLLSDLERRSEMASVRRFKASWSRMAAEDTVTQSVGRGPVNAGPLNSHMLVLRSLALMRKLSPHYLQRFLSHVDSLLWLDQANQKLALAKVKPARRSRPKK